MVCGGGFTNFTKILPIELPIKIRGRTIVLGEININKLSTNNNSREFFFEEGSKVKIDGKDNKNFEINVFEKIYPPKELNQKNTSS